MKYTDAGQERHAKRMQEDPEYRKKILEYYREYNKKKKEMILDKDAFVGIHELDGIRFRIMFVFPNLKLFAWRLDEPGWAVFALPGAGDEDVEIDLEASGFHQDENGYWVKPNGDSVVVFINREFSFEDYDYVFKTYFAEEYAIYRKQQKEQLLNSGYNPLGNEDDAQSL